MSNCYVRGCQINTHIKHCFPNTVLFNINDEKITVARAKNVLDYILGELAHKDLRIDIYKKAKTVFSAIKLILENKQPPKVTKEDMKSAIDVLEEIRNSYARSDAEKEYNARCALMGKMLIDEFGGAWYE